MRQRDILWFWLPLFASWLLMSAEGPVISASISRLPNEVVMLAAMGIVTSLSVTIESPIINLLATSTALVRDYESYRLVRRFTIHWCVALTVLTLLVAYTPLFDVIIYRWLDLPAEVAEWVRPGMKIMLLWSAAIGWRRFHQGIMIRYKQTRSVAYGTLIRLFASGGVVILLAVWADWPGVVIGSLALMAGVLAEAAYATYAVQPLLRHHLQPKPPEVSVIRLTYRELFWFHLPLAGTSLLLLLVQPLVTSSLARLERPTESLAAWPILFQILLMARAAAMALPEVIIALHQDSQTFGPLRRFSLGLVLAVTGGMVIFITTPFAIWYVYGVQDLQRDVGNLVLSSLAYFLLIPGLTVVISWLRGLLIQGRRTRYVNMAMAINLVITAVALAWGVFRQWPGLPAAALALNLALLGEVLYLILRTRQSLPVELNLFRSPEAQPTQP